VGGASATAYLRAVPPIEAVRAGERGVGPAVWVEHVQFDPDLLNRIPSLLSHVPIFDKLETDWRHALQRGCEKTPGSPRGSIVSRL
jgi:hypothetical protein